MGQFLKSFTHALNGIKISFKGRNFKVQFVCGLLVIFFSIISHLSSIEWLVILTLIALVLAAETFNTSIEEFANVAKKNNGLDYFATKEVRDLAAGAVLIVSIISVIVGLIIFLPRIL